MGSASEKELQENLDRAAANVVDLQIQNKALLEQLKVANDEIAESVYNLIPDWLCGNSNVGHVHVLPFMHTFLPQT